MAGQVFMLDSHFVQQTLLVAPVCFNLNEQFEMAAMAQHLFNVLPRAHADLFQALRAVANDDLFL